MAAIMPQLSTVATAVASGLQAAGIDTVFGLPGGENVQVMEALRQAGVRFVLSEHESAAAFMASALAQLTRRPAACLTTLGPGAVNATAGVAHAFLDRSPVAVITAQMPKVLRPCHTHQFVDLRSLFGSITKDSFEVTAQNACTVVEEALSVATRGIPGPVHLQISNDVAVAPIEPTERNRPAEPSPEVIDPTGPEALFRAAADLEEAERPVIVVGLGLEPEAPYAELLRFAERLGAPVLTTPKAKGAVPASHPLGSETIGLTRTDPGYELIAEADRVVAVGMDVVEVVLPWSVESSVLWIAPWRDQIGSATAEQALIGPIGLTLAKLTECLQAPRSTWGIERSYHYRQRRDRLSRAAAAGVQAGTIAPQTVLREVRSMLPPDAVVTTDVGSHKILAALEWDVDVPNRYLVSNGLSSMGFGLSAAAGAALAGYAPVLCFIGDAGLLMCAGSLSTLAQLTVSVVIVVMVDGALDLIRSHQRRSGVQPYGTEFPAPDVARIGEAFGLQAATVATIADLKAEIRRAMGRDRASVIGVQIDSECYRGSFYEPR